MKKAISEGQRLADIAKRKAEAAEVAQAATISKKETVEEVVIAKNETTIPAQWVSFKAFMTVEQALMLKDFFDSNNIKFTSI